MVNARTLARFSSHMSLSKPDGLSLVQGVTLREQARALAIDLGNMIEKAAQDTKGRIKLNPIITTLEERLGSPCRLDSFKMYRSSLLEKLATYHGKSVENICIANGGRFESAGTW